MDGHGRGRTLIRVSSEVAVFVITARCFASAVSGVCVSSIFAKAEFSCFGTMRAWRKRRVYGVIPRHLRADCLYTGVSSGPNAG